MSSCSRFQVVDAIDDIKTKAELQAHCVRAGLRVLSALGAGGKVLHTHRH